MFCIYCGKEIADDSKFCPHCGKFVESVQYSNAPYQNGVNAYNNPADDDNLGWGVLGFFFPLIGLILYLVWNKEYPKRAKMCGKGALIGFITSVAVGIISAIAMVALVMIAYSVSANTGAITAEIVPFICGII